MEKLQAFSLMPGLVVTSPDKPQGRHLTLTPPPAKLWAEKNNIPYIQPAKLTPDIVETLQKKKWDVFVVASYGKIIPQSILDIPTHGTLNLHPSLLPLFRGSSPIEGQILADENVVGVSIMLLDKEMDHGPILSQLSFQKRESGDYSAPELEEKLAQAGGELLAKILPDWVSGKITPTEQDHAKATFTKKISKEDGHITLTDLPRQNYLKYLAYQPWPGTYFFTHRKGKEIRVVIKKASFENGTFKIERVVPEGGKEMSYEELLRGL